jgi:predicted RNase H-like HicB family nuclease
MHQARYEIVEDDGSFYGEIPAIPGVWANAKPSRPCREELESVLEGWLLLSIADHLQFRRSMGTASKFGRARVCWCASFARWHRSQGMENALNRFRDSGPQVR